MESSYPAAHDQKPAEPALYVAPEEGFQKPSEPALYVAPEEGFQKPSEPALYVPPEGGIPGPSGPPAPSGNPLSGGLTPWSSSLFGCFGDVGTCCITYWCPCITFGQIAEIVDKGATPCVTAGAIYALIAFVTGCGCIYSFFYRSKLRNQYMLTESPCADCLVHCCCETCALCQEYRELKSRGFDVSAGWQANVDRQNRGVAMAPVVQGGMTR